LSSRNSLYIPLFAAQIARSILLASNALQVSHRGQKADALGRVHHFELLSREKAESAFPLAANTPTCFVKKLPNLPKVKSDPPFFGRLLLLNLNVMAGTLLPLFLLCAPAFIRRIK